MTGKESSDAIRDFLVFIILLAVFGIIVAMLIYFTVDLPPQQAGLIAPANYIYK